MEEPPKTRWFLIKKWFRKKYRRLTSLRLPKKYIISFRNHQKEQWDKFILLMAIQNSFMVPIDLAFSPSLMAHPLYNIFDFLVDICFVVDIIMQFFTSFMNRMGAEVFDSRKIFKLYAFSGRFIMDFLPLLGSEIIVKSVGNHFKFFGMLKITRVARLNNMIAKMNLPKDIKAGLKLAKLVLFLLIWFHSMACGWYMAIYFNKFTVNSEGESMSWVPPSDFIDY